MPAKKTIMSKIVSEVRQPATCYDVRRCHVRNLRQSETGDRNDAELNEPRELDFSASTLKQGRLNQLVGSMAQIWARMSLGEAKDSAVDNVYANTRRGAQKLAKSDAAKVAALLGGEGDPVELFDTLKTNIACSISDDGRFTCSRASMESMARLSWFSRFQWNLEASLAKSEPLTSLEVDDLTAGLAMEMLETLMRAVDEFGGITDHRRRGYSPAGTRGISYWEYELCSKSTVWLVSFTGTFSNSRISAWMVATYFFLLDSGQFGYPELESVDTIGCVDPLTGECMTIRFDEIDEASARNTMELVNGYKDELVSELAGAFDQEVRKSIIENRIAAAADRGEAELAGSDSDGRKKALRSKRKIGKVDAPTKSKLDEHLAQKGKGSLYSYVAATIGQPRGGAIPSDCFEQVMTFGDEDGRDGESDDSADSGNARLATYVVPTMLRFRYGDFADRKTLFSRQYLGASAVDESEIDTAAVVGLPGISAVEYLDGLVGDAYKVAGDTAALAGISAKINLFGKYAGKQDILDTELEIGIAEASISKNDAEKCTEYFERTILGVEKLGGEISAFDYECLAGDNPYIESAKAPYLTETAMVRLSFSKGSPKPAAILTDAMTRYFGVANGLLSEDIVMAIINPRVGTVSMLPSAEIGAVNSVAAKAAAPFGVV